MVFGTSVLGPRFIDRLCDNGYESSDSVGTKEFVGRWNNYGLLTVPVLCLCMLLTRLPASHGGGGGFLLTCEGRINFFLQSLYCH